MYPILKKAKEELLQHHKPSLKESDLDYCLNLTNIMLDEVLNKHYYPNLSDENINDIKLILLIKLVSSVDYYKNEEVRAYIKNLDRKLEAYYANHYLLYLNDQDSLFQNILRYLTELFANII